MTDLELVLTMLAEAATTDISKTAKPQTFEENKHVAKRGGKVAGIARQALEAETGKPVITEKNAFDFQQLVTDIVEDAAEPVSYTHLHGPVRDFHSRTPILVWYRS